MLSDKDQGTLNERRGMLGKAKVATAEEAREIEASFRGAAASSAAPDPNATEGAEPVDSCWGALLAQSDGAGCTPNFKKGRLL